MNEAPPQQAALPPTTFHSTAAVVDDLATERLVIPVIAETATFSTRRVDTGHAVRVRKIVHDDLVTVDGACAIDQVQVERVTIDRVLDGPIGVRHEGEVMVVPVVEERLVTVKQLVLVEEIRITRSSRVQPSAVPVMLRREEVVVERFDPDTGEWQAVDTPAATDKATGR